MKEELELVLVVPEDLFVDIRNFSSLRRENTRLLVGYLFSTNHTEIKHRRSHKTFAFPADRSVSRSLPPSLRTLHTHHSSNAFPKYNQLVNMTGNLCRDAWSQSHCSSPTYSATSNHESLFKHFEVWVTGCSSPAHNIRGIYPRQQRLAFCS